MGFSRLHGFAAKGSFDELSSALRAEPNLATEKDDWGFTPLHYACEKGELSCAEALLDAAADINSIDRFGHTPLYMACQSGNLQIVEFLLSESADPTLSAVTGSSPMHAAAGSTQRSLEILELLLKNLSRPSGADGHDNSPLHVASKRGDSSSARLLSKFGYDPDALNFFGESPMILAPDDTTRHAMHDGWADYARQDDSA